MQQGLTRDFDVQPPTWKVPIAAMKCAEIEQKHMQDLKVVLGMLFIVVCAFTCERNRFAFDQACISLCRYTVYVRNCCVLQECNRSLAR